MCQLKVSVSLIVSNMESLALLCLSTLVVKVSLLSTLEYFRDTLDSAVLPPAVPAWLGTFSFATSAKLGFQTKLRWPGCCQ